MPRLTARDVRARNEWDVELEPGWTVHCRKVDIVNSFLSNLIPLPLMAALERLRSGAIDLMTETDQGRQDTLELMRRYAVCAIVDPLFSIEEPPTTSTPSPICEICGYRHPPIAVDHAPIATLTSDQLLLVWQSGPPKPTLPEVSAATADTFRIRDEPRQVAPAVPNGQAVSSAPQHVPDGTVIAELRHL